jgi:hypothetical protein
MEKIKIIYPSELTEKYLEERRRSGFLQMARVKLPDGSQYPVHFYEPISLVQDLKISGNFVAEPGLIVIPEITLKYMEDAVEQLYNQGYFDYLRPLTGKLFVDELDLEPRAKARYAFNTIVNRYLESKGVVCTGSKFEGVNWLVNLVSGTNIVASANVYYTESIEGNKFNFETKYKPERGGVIAEILPYGEKFDILIPKSQIAHVEKE